MVKYFTKTTNEEVKIGEELSIRVPVKTPYGETDCIFNVKVTPANLDQLIKDGHVIKKKEVKMENVEPKIKVKCNSEKEQKEMLTKLMLILLTPGVREKFITALEEEFNAR